MAEVWIPIHNYLGLYEISNQGNTRSIDRVVKINKFGTTYTKTYYGKVLATKTNRNGYVETNLWKNNEGKTYSVHRLVLENFCPTRNTTLEVNHIDGNKLNNNLENLEWVTSSQNKLHRSMLRRLTKNKSQEIITKN